MSLILRVLSITMILVMIISLFTLPVHADNTDVVFDENLFVQNDVNDDYQLYLESIDSYSDADTTLSATDFSAQNMEREDEAIVQFNVPETAKYCIEIEYTVSDTKAKQNTLSVLIDGKQLFEKMSSIDLKTIWTNQGEKRVDSWGDEFAAEQIVYEAPVKQRLLDSDGIELEPYEFMLEKGIHNISIKLTSGSLTLNNVYLVSPERTTTYEEYVENYKNIPIYDGKEIKIQGEDANYKTSKSLIAKADNSDASFVPHNALNSVLNTIGSGSWNVPTDAITWKIDIEKDGMYMLSFKYKQSESMNATSYRILKIDNKIPFEEAKNIGFEYDTTLNIMTLGKSKAEPYYIYLTKGEHYITLEATLGEMSSYYRRLEKQVEQIGDQYLRIAMITGESPDINRDYDLFEQIPDLENILTDVYESLTSLASDMKKSSGKRSGSIVAALNNMNRILKAMLDNPYDAHRYVKDYYSNYSSLGSWLYDMKSMPLSLDEIILSSNDYDTKKDMANFFEKLGFSITKFFVSFSEEYGKSRDYNAENKTIKIWVNWGRDQAQVLSNLIQTDFTKNTGINVQLEVVNASLAKGILSGDPPDLSLHLSRTEPVNLAMRDVLYDLTQFEDFESVMKQFQPSAAQPYYYNGGCYALPDTQSFYVLYYRKDIFEQLGLEVPNTWEEFIDVTVEIQRNKMQVWIPYTNITSDTTVHVGVGGLSLFPTLVMQKGLSLYDNDLQNCTLDRREVIDVFEYWTDFYTKYKLTKEASFYNRFRVGTMPMGIESYTLYQTLSAAAPEIEGRWSIAMIPGTVQEDGTINRNCSGAGTGAAVLKGSGVEKEAWEFIKWWTSSDIQLRYSNEIETILGPVGRVATANIGALENMAWNDSDLDIILEQWEQVMEIPEIPGSYYLSRAVDQCFWQVSNDNVDARSALEEWSQIVDREIKRKRTEYES